MFNTPAQKYTLLFFSVLPLFYIIFFVFYVFRMMNMLDANQEPELDYFMWLFGVHLLMMLLSLVLLVLYIMDAVKNKAYSDGLRVMWIVLFLFVPFVTYIAYWFLYIRPGAGLPENIR